MGGNEQERDRHRDGRECQAIIMLNNHGQDFVIQCNDSKGDEGFGKVLGFVICFVFFLGVLQVAYETAQRWYHGAMAVRQSFISSVLRQPAVGVLEHIGRYAQPLEEVDRRDAALRQIGRNLQESPNLYRGDKIRHSQVSLASNGKTRPAYYSSIKSIEKSSDRGVQSRLSSCVLCNESLISI